MTGTHGGNPIGVVLHPTLIKAVHMTLWSREQTRMLKQECVVIQKYIGIYVASCNDIVV